MRNDFHFLLLDYFYERSFLMIKGYVNSLETFGLVDGPGVRFVVFLQGCKLRCKFCHNPETWSLSGGDEWTPENLFNHVRRYKTYWKNNGGITVSGGEPLLQMEFVTEFFKLAKKENIHTAIDTAGQPFSEEREYLDKIWSFISFIDVGPYLKGENVYSDSFTPDLKNEVYFESKTMNIVSVLDFLNAILIPALRVTPPDELTIVRKNLLVKWVRLLVDGFYGNGIFWNEKGNRSDWQAKHTDLGHTSKAYGILYKANDLLRSWGMPTMYENVMAGYPEIVKASAHPRIGWLTDFDHSPTTFQKRNLQWWRHILIDQTVYLYAHDYPELIPLLKQGVAAWFSCDYIDRTRACRGIREGLSPDGHALSDDDSIASKANCWKNAYHEVEHVVTLCGTEGMP